MTITPDQVSAKSSNVVVTLTILNKKTKAPINLSSATKLEFRLKPKQVKAVGKKATATLVGDGSAGQIKFTTTISTFDVPGDWDVQGYVTLAGYDGYTTTSIIKVLPIIEA